MRSPSCGTWCTPPGSGTCRSVSPHVLSVMGGAAAAARPRKRGQTVKIAIVGCGAIGGYVGAKLALAGEELTLLVRGPTLDAVRAHGIRLTMADGSVHVA